MTVRLPSTPLFRASLSGASGEEWGGAGGSVRDFPGNRTGHRPAPFQPRMPYHNRDDDPSGGGGAGCLVLLPPRLFLCIHWYLLCMLCLLSFLREAQQHTTQKKTLHYTTPKITQTNSETMKLRNRPVHITRDFELIHCQIIFRCVICLDAWYHICTKMWHFDPDFSGVPLGRKGPILREISTRLLRKAFPKRSLFGRKSPRKCMPRLVPYQSLSPALREAKQKPVST